MPSLTWATSIQLNPQVSACLSWDSQISINSDRHEGRTTGIKSSMDFFIQAFLGLVALLFLYNLCNVRSKPGKTTAMEPPQPPGSWPLLGHLPLILYSLRRQPFYEIIAAMADKYGPIFMLQLGKRRILVVGSLEGLKECFTTNDRAVANHPKSAVSKYLCYDHAMLGHAPYGPYWRDLRKLTMVHLLSNAQLEALKHIREAEINTHMKELCQVWKKNGQRHVKVGMRKWFNDLTFRTIRRMVAGKRSGTNGDADDEEFKNCIDRFFRYSASQFVASDVLPIPEWMDWSDNKKGMISLSRDLDSIIKKYVEEHRERKRSGEGKGDEDFIDVLLSVVDPDKFPDHDPDTVIKANALAHIIGGSDSLAVTMSITLSFLLNNPHVLKRAQEEVDIHVGKDRNADETDINSLVYLQAIVKESLRLSPLATFIPLRETTEACRIGGFHVPPGTCVLVASGRVHRNPRLWSDPLVFKPERFLEERVGVDVRGQHFELVPFAAGRRSCPGISLALQATHLTLARLLHGFEMARPSNAPMDVESLTVGNPKAPAVDVLLSPRLRSQLYE